MTDRMTSILRLALHEGTGETEWHAAAIMFVRLLRKDKTEAEDLRISKTRQDAPQGRQGSERSDPWAGAFERARRQREEQQKREQQARAQEGNPKSPDMTYRMPFGKHRGVTLNRVPTDYITWMLNNIPDLDARFKAKLQAEYNSRFPNH